MVCIFFIFPTFKDFFRILALSGTLNLLGILLRALARAFTLKRKRVSLVNTKQMYKPEVQTSSERFHPFTVIIVVRLFRHKRTISFFFYLCRTLKIMNQNQICGFDSDRSSDSSAGESLKKVTQN